MKSKTEAIIINSMNLGEADKLVTFFSIDRGMLRGVARNARKSFRRFGAGLEAFTTCRLHLHEREHQELVRIESVDIIIQPAAICDDLSRAAAGAVMLELVQELLPSNECNTGVFRLLSRVIKLLNAGEDPVFLLRIFEIRLLSLLGYQPKLDHCLSCGKRPNDDAQFFSMKGGIVCKDCMVSSGDRQIKVSQGTAGFYYQALRMELDKISRLKPSSVIMTELNHIIAAHLFHILGKNLRSTDFLRSVCTL
jgi:DNA repair protein RecO (recombination protein O)